VIPNWSSNNSYSKTDVIGIAGKMNVYRPEHFRELTEKSKTKIKLLQQKVYELCQNKKTVEHVRLILDNIDEISNQLCLCLDFLELVRCLHEDEHFRSEASNAITDFSILLHELNNDNRLHLCLKQITEDKTLVSQLTILEQHCLHMLKKDMEKYGSVGQDSHEELKNKLIQLNAAIGKYANQFGDIIASHKEKLTKEYIPLNIKDSEGIIQKLRDKYPSMFKLELLADGREMLYIHSSALRHQDGHLRKFAYISTHSADARALEILDKLLDARHEFAKTISKPTYAHHALSSLMAQTPEKVKQFLDELSENIRPQAEKEIELLRKEKIMREGPDCDKTIYAWDFNYYKRIYQAKHVSETILISISDYLHYQNCLKGIYIVCERLFGIKLVEVPMGKYEAWAKNIKKIELYEDTGGTYLGTLYLDLFTRPYKIGGNSSFCTQVAKTTINQKPIAAIVLNVQGEYFTMSEVVSLFHELGHAIHTCIAQTPYQNLSGTRASIDWVEVPSQFMEHFATDYRILSRFAKHRDTGKVLPKELFNDYVSQKNMFKALQVQSQVVYAMVDLMLHMNEHKRLGITTTELLYRIRGQYHSLPITQNDSIDKLYPISYHGNLLHLTNYAASYYSYLYAKISSDHLWYKYFNDKEDPLDREAAEPLKKAMSYGGSKSEASLLWDILGEEPSPSYFLKEFQ
jgi:intermediate peptidase